jgi:predicted HTH domain antitoxin
MEQCLIKINFPAEIFSVFRKSPEEFRDELRLTAAVKWYEMGMISQEKAAEVAGVSREDFILSLKRYNVSPFQYTAREILNEAGYDS